MTDAEPRPAHSGMSITTILASLASVIGVVLVLSGVILDVGERISNAQHVSDGLDHLSKTFDETHSNDAKEENEWRRAEEQRADDLRNKIDDLRNDFARFDTQQASTRYDRAQHR